MIPAAIAAGVLPAAWAAAPAPRPADELARLAADLPPGVEIVFALHNAAAARSTTAGRATAALLDELGVLRETRGAWRGLAETLGWSPGRAFDELLGRRVTFVGRGLRDGRPAQWAVIGGVSRTAEQRLRSRLRPVPRDIVAGRTVLSVEDGAFELVLMPDAGGDTGESATFVLAPAGSSSLLAELIPRASETLGRGSPRGTTEPRAMLVVRGPTVGSEDAFLAVTAASGGAGRGEAVHVRLLASAPGVPAPLPIAIAEGPPQAAQRSHAPPARAARGDTGPASRDRLARWLEDNWSVRVPATLGWIESVAWETRAVEAGRIDGELTIRLLDDIAAGR